METKIEKYQGRLTKKLDSKMDRFEEWGLDNGGSIYVDKITPIRYEMQFEPGDNGIFSYHRAYFGKDKENKREVWILDDFESITPISTKSDNNTENRYVLQQGKIVQEVKNEDFLEIQRRTETTSGKMDARVVAIKLDTVRIYGDLLNQPMMQTKLDHARKLTEYFDSPKKK